MRNLLFISVILISSLFFTKANATMVHILQTNLFSWVTMDPRKSPPPITNMTSYINAHDFDFIASQENDYSLTDSLYKLDSKYRLAANRQDASIFYNSQRWSLIADSWKSIPMTSDGGGPRVAVFAKFQNSKGESVVIATTHLCIAWGGHPDCVGGQQSAHINDATKISEFLKSYSEPQTAVLVTGDFNNLDNSFIQAQKIESVFANVNLTPVKSQGTFIGPTYGATYIDFIYFRHAALKNALIYTAAQGNPSDHSAIDATFQISNL